MVWSRLTRHAGRRRTITTSPAPSVSAPTAATSVPVGEVPVDGSARGVGAPRDTVAASTTGAALVTGEATSVGGVEGAGEAEVGGDVMGTGVVGTGVVGATVVGATVVGGTVVGATVGVVVVGTVVGGGHAGTTAPTPSGEPLGAAATRPAAKANVTVTASATASFGMNAIGHPPSRPLGCPVGAPCVKDAPASALEGGANVTMRPGPTSGGRARLLATTQPAARQGCQ